MRLKIALLLGFTFLVLGIITLPHYGVNWDAINHLPRGQAYLHFFLTGKKDYSDLPNLSDSLYVNGKWYWQNPRNLFIDADAPKEKITRRSYYQLDDYDFGYFMEKDGYGHPPASDILSSFFNIILFQKLKLVNDIDSYRVYGIALSALAIGVIYYWVSFSYGKLAGFVSALSLSLYPLFWAESHLNTEKDVPETVFWTLSLFLIWLGVTKRKSRWVILSSIPLGLGLGTKFNMLFISFVVIPWLFYYAFKNKWLKNFPPFVKKNWKFILSFLVVPILAVVIFVALWPYLWTDPVGKIQQVFGFYREIGRTQAPSTFKINTYPLIWIFYTTPEPILFWGALGLIYGIIHLFSKREELPALAILWLIIPVARVVLPGATIYGGVRQIMEFIPPISILAGIGAYRVVNLASRLKQTQAVVFLIIISFFPLIIKLIQIHPNENAYFNALIGGLKGAKGKNIPYWGNTFGGAYRQAVNWINDNAPKGSKVVFAYELLPNIPIIFFRRDLEVNNQLRSGYLRQGEYALTLNFEGVDKRSYYDSYLDRLLEPVYEVRVDDVPVIRVWKNDDAHLRKAYQKELVNYPLKIEKLKNSVVIELKEEVSLSRIEGIYNERFCDPLKYAYVQVSKNGDNWTRLPGVLPEDWLIPVIGEQPKRGKFIHAFAGDRAKYILVVMEPEQTCLKSINSLKLYYFPDGF